MSLTSAADRAGMSARRFRAQTTGALFAGFIALAVMAGTAAWLVGKANSYTDWVQHTYAAEGKIARTQMLLERTENARRGFLLTASPISWRNYEAGAAAVPDALRDLQDFLADNPSQTRRLTELRPRMERLLGMMTHVMALAQTGDREGAVASFRDGHETNIMQESRVVLDAMLKEEQRLLQLRTREEAHYSRLLLAVVLAGAVLLALLSAGAVWTIRRYAADLIRAQDELKRFNAGLEDEVRARTADLSRANEEIQRFAYIVSHDLRSPLVNVMGFTSELEVSIKPLRQLVEAAAARAPDLVTPDAKAAVDLDLPEAIGFIRSSTQKMDRLINAILKLSREGRRTLTPEPVDMTALARTAADSLKSQAERRGAEIAVEGELPPAVTDRLAMEQVLSNLMENAVKYAAPGRAGRVVVRGRREGEGLVYEVEDNGRGIDPKDHERIFDLFRRSGPQDQPGEGIGLAAVSALMHRLGGRIGLSSALDQGATFRLFLPAAPSGDREVKA